MIAAGDLPTGCFIEVLVRVGRIEPRRAEVAEVSLATVADHMVAAVCLLSRRRAGRARSGVQFDVLQRRLLVLGTFFCRVARPAPVELSVPGLVAATAEGKAAVLADSQELLARLEHLGLRLCLLSALGILLPFPVGA